MGLLAMLICTLILFIILTSFLSIGLSILLAVLFLCGWFLYNIYSGKTGLIKANLNAYFIARARGMNHDDALNFMVDSRYKQFPERKEIVIVDKLDFYKDIDDDSEDDLWDIDADKEQLASVILNIQNIETGLYAPYDEKQKLYKLIYDNYDRMYEKFKNRIV